MKNFFYLVILTLIFILNYQSVFAQEKSSSQAVVNLSQNQADYQLPYPGLLPDSPLYFLKTIRDKIVDFLVSAPNKKAELDLLQADKRLSASIVLVAKGKYDLAESTISKGENYFEDAILKLKEAKSQGMDIKGIAKKLSLSAKKHQLVLRDFEKKASGNTQKKFRILIIRMSGLEEKVSKIGL